MFGRKKVDYWDMGVGVRGKNLDAIFDGRFEDARMKAARLASKTDRPLNKMRWRAHVAVWAAEQALATEGDFVECGVEMGFLSHTICAYHTQALQDRTFYLFDTFQGIPPSQTDAKEAERTQAINKRQNYQDTLVTVSERFSEYPFVKLVPGRLPDTLKDVALGKISYLSIDLNVAATEMAVIDALWPKLSPGAVVLLDDYAWAEHRAQKAAWDGFAASRGRPILSLPTGQGLLIN